MKNKRSMTDILESLLEGTENLMLDLRETNRVIQETNKKSEKDRQESTKARQESAKARQESAKARREAAKARQESAKEQAEFRKSMKAMQKELGGVSNSNGDVAESYFINSFSQNMSFAGETYDEITPNLRKSIKTLRLQGEYDLVLYNCKSIVIIEIKYKAKKENVEELLQKAPVFKQLFPQYAHYDIYLGLAALHIDVRTEKESIKQGIAVIKQVGKTMVINDAHLKVF